VTVAAPVVADDSYTVTVGGVLDVAAPGVLANDDPIPAGLFLHTLSTFTEASGYVSWTLNADGSTRLSVPATTTAGTYDLSYCIGTSRAPGSACTSNTATVHVTVTPPEAVDDAYAVDADDTLIVDASGVLGNDRPGGLTPGARHASAPAHGTVVLRADGGFTYDPDDTFEGADMFTYELFDVDTGALVDTATVTIAVARVLPAPGPPPAGPSAGSGTALPPTGSNAALPPTGTIRALPATGSGPDAGGTVAAVLAMLAGITLTVAARRRSGARA
jgi:hypothetical protein